MKLDKVHKLAEHAETMVRLMGWSVGDVDYREEQILSMYIETVKTLDMVLEYRNEEDYELLLALDLLIAKLSPQVEKSWSV